MDLTLMYVGCCASFLLLAGYFLPSLQSKALRRILGWIFAIATAFVAVKISGQESPVVRMLIIVFLQLLSMKVLVAVESYANGNRLNFFQWIAFAVGWFGMKPTLFEVLPSSSLLYQKLVLKALIRIFLGFILLYLSAVAGRFELLTSVFLAQLLLVAGISFILHFGILNLSTAWWRAFGVNAQELFKQPYRSNSLKEFWGKRWNIAFSEMTQLIAYRPLKTRLSADHATMCSFLFSGILHEVAISLPVRGGYGFPMMYFGIHAIAMQMEARSPIIKRIIQHRHLSRVWVIALLILPMPLLFHEKFIDEVLIPLRAFLLQGL
jgi:alginate O-acetyltransferase complex protein AlgI